MAIAWQLALPVAPVTATHTHQPAPGDVQGNVSRQLAGAVAWGVEGGAAPAPPLAASRAAGASALLLLQFECLRHCARRKAWPGWLGYARPLFPGGRARRSKAVASSRVFFSFSRRLRPVDEPLGRHVATSWHRGQVASDVAISKHRPLFTQTRWRVKNTTTPCSGGAVNLGLKEQLLYKGYKNTAMAPWLPC
jgi:hypothetical protein